MNELIDVYRTYKNPQFHRVKTVFLMSLWLSHFRKKVDILNDVGLWEEETAIRENLCLLYENFVYE